MNEYIDFNSNVLAEEGARIGNRLDYVSIGDYAPTPEKWEQRVRSAVDKGWELRNEAYSGNQGGPCGGLNFIKEGGYVYTFVTDMYGDWRGYFYGYTAEHVHNNTSFKDFAPWLAH